MKGEKRKGPGDMRINPDEFDEIMRRALGVPQERCETEKKVNPCQEIKKSKRKSLH